MEPILVSPAAHLLENGHTRVSVSIRIGEELFDLWYRFSAGPVAEGADGFLAATLAPAMKLGRNLRFAEPISPRLLKAVPTIQDIFHSWNPDWQRVSIDAPSQPTGPHLAARAAACFFSGGVDSFYTFLKHQDELDKIIYIHALENPLQSQPLRDTVATAIRGTASALEKPLIEVETNIRQLSGDAGRRFLSRDSTHQGRQRVVAEGWAHPRRSPRRRPAQAHHPARPVLRKEVVGHDHEADPLIPFRYFDGSALASIALLLAPQLSRVYIAAPYSYATLIPGGVHPLLDPLWSTERTEIIHDGCEASRFEKVATIAHSDVALASLRVCWENRGEAYNCGQCEKCVRTMVALRIVGALDRCKTFNRALNLAKVARMVPPGGHGLVFVKENLRAVEQRGTDPALAKALRDCVAAASPGGAAAAPSRNS